MKKILLMLMIGLSFSCSNIINEYEYKGYVIEETEGILFYYFIIKLNSKEIGHFYAENDMNEKIFENNKNEAFLQTIKYIDDQIQLKNDIKNNRDEIIEKYGIKHKGIDYYEYDKIIDIRDSTDDTAKELNKLIIK